jgi:putative ABC transport system permease protein
MGKLGILNLEAFMLGDAFRMAGKSIVAHKARSFLTTLGVVIGVSSVITLLAIGEGLKNDVESTVSSFGADKLFVISGDVGAFTGGSNATLNPASLVSGDILTFDDVKAIRNIEGVELVVPIAIVPGTVRLNDKTSGATVVGTDPEVLDVFEGSFKLEEGRSMTWDDQGDKVLVLGNRPAKQLFGEESSVGKTVMIGKDEFEVIGKLSPSSSAGSLTGSDFEIMSLIPFNTATEITGKEQIFRLVVRLLEGYEVQKVAEEIEDDLLTRHEKGDASVLTPDDILNLLATLLNTVATAVSAIAAISLIVGGIGIMNIMLVSVTERTREIGIRKAVGATRRAILTQFLIEAVVISLLGGLLGLGLAIFGVFIVDLKTALVPAVTPLMIFLAVGVSVGVGIIFGLTPAISAARKDPIEALRYE